MFKERDTQIGTLKVRAEGTGADRPALFRRMAYLFNTVDLNPPGIPPSGILIVRRMGDPLPGQLAPQLHAVRADREWERAAQQVLYEKYREAARPTRGFIPSNAEAVFFTDEAQMLAALALDKSRGEAWTRWWWKVILRNVNTSSEPSALLAQKIAYLPAALNYLAEWGTASIVMNTFSIDQALTVLAALGREYHVEAVTAHVFHPDVYPEERPADDEFPIKIGKKPKQREGETAAGEAREAKEIPRWEDTLSTLRAGKTAPWEQWLPSHWVPVHMARERATLLGIGLSLYRAPTKVRTPFFIQHFQKWWEYRESAIASSDFSGPPNSLPKKGVASPTRDATIPAEKSKNGNSPFPQIHFPHQKRKKMGTGKNAMKLNKSFCGVQGRFFQKEPLTAGGKKSNAPREKTKTFGRIRFQDVSKYQPAPSLPLEKPDDIAGQLHDALLEYERSNALAEKEHEKKGITEEGVDTQLGGVFYLVNVIEQLDLLTRINKECSPEQQPGPWRILELLAKALLGDQYQELETDPLWDVLALLDNREEETLLEEDPPWLELVLPCIQSFLRETMGPATKKNPEPGRTLLFVPARLYVTAAHVDIVMSMEYISIPARLAGLDRDPGWMPQFGRVILFHFE